MVIKPHPVKNFGFTGFTIFIFIARVKKWVLDADIKGCFDNIESKKWIAAKYFHAIDKRKWCFATKKEGKISGKLRL